MYYQATWLVYRLSVSLKVIENENSRFYIENSLNYSILYILLLHDNLLKCQFVVYIFKLRFPRIEIFEKSNIPKYSTYFGAVENKYQSCYCKDK